MRIAMLSPVGPAHGRGGVQDIVWSLATGLAQRGHEVTLITTGRVDGPSNERRENVDLEYLTGVPPMRASGPWARASLARVRALHAQAPLGAIHSQSFCGLHLCGVLPGVAVTASLHGTHWDELRTRAGLIRETLPGAPLAAARAAALWLLMLDRYRREGPQLRRAEAVIATSVEQRAVLRERYRIQPARLHDVWNGIDTRLFSPRPPDAALRATLGSGPVLLAVARLYQEKGLQHALRALPGILARHPHAMFVIVGDGPYRATLEALARSLGAAPHVRFAGSVPLAELPRWYSCCDVFVNPTVRINGYDLTILQAMAHAKPVVVSAIGSVPTAVADGRDGLLAAPGDAAAITAQVTRLLGEPALAAALGAAARATIEARFSVAAMVDGTLAVYAAATWEAAR